MKVFRFGNLTIQLLFRLLCPVVYSLRTIILTKFLQYSYKPLLITFCVFLSEVLFGSISIIYKHFNTTKEYKANQSKNSNIIIQDFVFLDNEEKVESKRYYLIILLLSVLFFTACTILSIICSGNDILPKKLEIELKNLKILFVSILSIIFISKKLYKHQVIGIIIAFFGVAFNIVLLIKNNIDEIKKEKLGFFFILSYPLSYIMLSIQCVIEKYLMEVYRLSPYKLLFFEGVFGVLICIVSSIISYFIPCGEYEFCKFNNNKLYDFIADMYYFWNDGNFRLFIFLFFITSGFFYFFYMLTLYYFSPNQQAVSEPMSSLFMFFYFAIAINFEKTWQKGLCLVGYISIIISALIYNELLIIYICGLETDCKIEVYKRAREDSIHYTTTNNNVITLQKLIANEQLFKE